MGNCCGGGGSEVASGERQTLTSNGPRVQTFQGQGHRLGTAAERVDVKPEKEQMNRDDANNTPAPAVDDNLTEEERAKIRADRAKAAEARLKQATGKKKKKKTTDAAPLRGPNTEPLMRWN